MAAYPSMLQTQRVCGSPWANWLFTYGGLCPILGQECRLPWCTLSSDPLSIVGTGWWVLMSCVSCIFDIYFMQYIAVCSLPKTRHLNNHTSVSYVVYYLVYFSFQTCHTWCTSSPWNLPKQQSSPTTNANHSIPDHLGSSFTRHSLEVFLMDIRVKCKSLSA